MCSLVNEDIKIPCSIISRINNASSSLLPEKPNTPIYTYSRLDEYTTKKQKLLDVYYVNLAKNDPLYNSTLEMIRKDNELTTESFRTASYIIFTPSYFESQLYNVNTGTKLNGVSGDYKNLGKQFEGKTFKTILSFLNEGEHPSLDYDNVKEDSQQHNR